MADMSKTQPGQKGRERGGKGLVSDGIEFLPWKSWQPMHICDSKSKSIPCTFDFAEPFQ